MSLRDTRLWTWHVAAGLIILILLGMHMGVMHLDDVLHITGPGSANPAGGNPIDWANVVERGQQVGFVVFYIVLLGTALFHGLYGLRNILLELNPSPGLQRLLSVLLMAVGFGMFAFGTWAAVVSRTVALTATP
jgi:succinate dehydrogenase / fumarate reductase membrane anchor subunit